MSLFGRLLGRETKSTDFSALTWAALLGGQSSKAGASVSVTTALGVSTVFACCRVLAEGIAQLPLKLYRENGRTKKLATDHPAYMVLSRRPNEWQSSFEWRETAMYHALLCKGSYTVISRDSRGRVLELLPIMPSSVVVVQDQQRVVAYKITDAKGIIAVLPRSSVLQVRGPSWDGLVGMEVVSLAREAIGLSIAAEETLAKLHTNGTRPAGVLSTDGKLTEEQLKRIKASWSEAYSGSANAFKTVVLDAGLKFSQMSLAPADTQTNESRRHQVEELARFFRVFPQMIGYADKTATYASAEQFFIAHVVHSLGPWIERWEQAIERDVLTREEVASGLFPKLITAALLRGDNAGRAGLYKAGITDGWLTRNEARDREDLDPIGGLDEPLVPLNMAAAAAPDSAASGMALVDAAAANVQGTALNGAQVESLRAILQSVANGQLPASSARAMIASAFPAITASDIDGMMNGLDSFTPTAQPSSASAA